MATKKYGINKVSYEVFEETDGSIAVRVRNDNKAVRKTIASHLADIKYFLSNFSQHGMDDSRARYWLVELVNDHRAQFERGQVVFVMS
jgi:hypothetical protein